MAMRAIEGFETRRHSTYMQRLYTGGGNMNATFSSTGGRRHGSSVNGTNYSFLSAPVVTSAQNTWIVCFAMKISDRNVAIPGSAAGGVRLYSGGTTLQCGLYVQPGGQINTYKLELRRGATVLATTSDMSCGSLLAWQYFQWKVTIDTGTSGSSELRRWGYRDTTHTVEFNVSSINTADAGVAGADAWGGFVDAGGSSFMQLDDIVIMDSTGSANNDFTASPLTVFGAQPTSDGNSSDYTPSSGSTHWILVDDPIGGPPADTEFVKTETNGDKELFGYGNFDEVDGGSTAILGVQVTSNVQMLNSGSRDVAVLVRSGGSEARSADITMDDPVIVAYPVIFEENPVGPAAWTKTSFEAAEIGLETRS